MSARSRWLAIPLALALVGCEKQPAAPAKAEPPPKEAVKPEPAPKPEPKPEPKPAAKEEAPFQKAVLDGLAKAGLKVGEFEQTAARPYKAKACVQGEVEGLDVLVCSYEAEQPAQEATKSLEQFVGTATTGAVRQRGALSLAVADRKKSDLKGQQINKVLQAFAKGS
jgi:hypothetical protein